MRSRKMFNATHIQPTLKREACTHYFVQNPSIKNQLYRRVPFSHAQSEMGFCLQFTGKNMPLICLTRRACITAKNAPGEILGEPGGD